MSPEQTRGDHPRQDIPPTDQRSGIVAAATALLLQRGIGALTRREILDAGRVTERELDRFFPELDGLVHAIVDTQLDTVLRIQMPVLRAVGGFEDLHAWRTELLERSASGRGCMLGSLIYHLADRHDEGHRALAGLLAQWQGLLAEALARVQAAGQLRQDADPAGLAVGIMAALQGGYLLAHTAKDTEPLRAALDMALNHVRSYAA